ncbi:MAG: DUF3127 domain-containing protein [Brumimicrobium sp.]|nr:DUF3127 domain-containing protein [Brumimicrobium sp.]
MYTLNGTLKVKKDTQQISDSFRKREFVVTDGSGNYPQDIMFELTQDQTSLLDNINLNDLVTVTFNIRGREWTSPQGEVKYFNSLNAWRVEKTQNGGAAPANTQAQQPAAKIDATDVETFVSNEEDDDLPF